MKKFNELIDFGVKQALNDDQKVRQVVAQIVPRESLTHVQFCRVENGILKITLDNASWLARLRFASRQLIDELHNIGITVAEVTWHVAPEKINTDPRPQVIRKRERSQKSADIVASTANNINSEELRRALLKVAEQLRKRSG